MKDERDTRQNKDSLTPVWGQDTKLESNDMRHLVSALKIVTNIFYSAVINLPDRYFIANVSMIVGLSEETRYADSLFLLQMTVKSIR